jgi:hypothetical protein
MKTACFFVLSLIFSVSLNAASPAEKGDESEKRSELNAATILSFNGSVIDQNTGEKLVCAKIEIEDAGITVFTDIKGDFSISGFHPGEYKMKVSYISYEEREILSCFDENTKQMTITLSPL